jgi:hypothetical protein
MLTVFMWYFKTRGGGRDLSTAGRSFENKLLSLNFVPFRYEILSFDAVTCLVNCRLQQIVRINSMRCLGRTTGDAVLLLYPSLLVCP